MTDGTCEMRLDTDARELSKHGTAAFPVARYFGLLRDICVLPHWHEDMELVTVRGGTCIVVAGGEEHTVEKGQGFFVNAGALHAMPVRDISRECDFRSIVFHPRLVGAGVESAFWQRYVRPLTENAEYWGELFDGSEDWHGKVLRQFDAAWDACISGEIGFEFAVREALSKIVLFVLKSRPAAPAAPSARDVRNDGRIRQMLEYVQENYASHIAVEDLCRCAAISESECLRCFRSTVGTTPMQYVREFRLHKAAALLANSNLQTGEISGRCGFSDSAYFSRCFRAWSGMSPTQYRKHVRKGDVCEHAMRFAV